MDLVQDGWTLIPDVLAEDECNHVAEEIEDQFSASSEDAIESTRGRVVGGRNLLSSWNGWRRLIERPQVTRVVESNLGTHAGVVRALFFDKPPGESWALSLHRDKTIAVANHCEPVQPFSKPTRKAGVPHVQATNKLLSQMLTLRFHLDPMREENGPLTVVSGSHIYRECTSQSANSQPVRTIHCDRGDLFVMRPLLLHGSKSCHSTTTMHRRVVHLELAALSDLPGGYRWHQFLPIEVATG